MTKMIAPEQTTVKHENSVEAPAPFRPEGNGLGVNPARRSGRILARTWQSHLRAVAENPDAAIERHAELIKQRAVGYALFMAGKPAKVCRDSDQWGGWLKAQAEYKTGRFASYSTGEVDTADFTPAQRLGYRSALALQSGLQEVADALPA